ncbi:putative methyltransferase DDB_G0268948 [Saccoglossus kowalevskii]
MDNLPSIHGISAKKVGSDIMGPFDSNNTIAEGLEIQISDAYYKFRPSYPTAVVERIITFLGHKSSGPYNLAVDVGCGSGQSTRLLCDHFEKVIGYDVSESQVQYAVESNHSTNIEYKLGSAENIPVADSTVDLVTSATASNWFDEQHFYNEVDRILKPNGCVAIYGYAHALFHMNIHGKRLQNVFDELKYKISGEYGTAESHYGEIKLPYAESERVDTISIERDYTVADFAGFFKSRPGYYAYQDNNPQYRGTLDNLLVQKFMSVFDDVNTPPEKTVMHVTFPLYLFLGRKL